MRLKLAKMSGRQVVSSCKKLAFVLARTKQRSSLASLKLPLGLNYLAPVFHLLQKFAEKSMQTDRQFGQKGMIGHTNETIIALQFSSQCSIKEIPHFSYLTRAARLRLSRRSRSPSPSRPRYCVALALALVVNSHTNPNKRPTKNIHSGGFLLASHSLHSW